MPKKKKNKTKVPTESLKNVEEQSIVTENVAALEPAVAEEPTKVEEPVAEPVAVVEEPVVEEQWIEKKVNSMRLRNEPSIFVNTIVSQMRKLRSTSL